MSELKTKGSIIQVLDHGFVRLIDYCGSDERIVEAARVSYKSPSKGPESDKKLLEYLWKNKHTSPFEMPQITFNIKMPIFVMRQYVRHRTQSINEVSARYTQLEDKFYIPNNFRVQDKKNKQASFEYVDENCNKIARTKLLEQSKACYELYEVMLHNGIAKEMARLILPVNIYTEIYCHWDLKNLLHFIALRDDPHAQWEHQQYGKAIKEFLIAIFPWTMEAYEKYKFQVIEKAP